VGAVVSRVRLRSGSEAWRGLGASEDITDVLQVGVGGGRAENGRQNLGNGHHDWKVLGQRPVSTVRPQNHKY